VFWSTCLPRIARVSANRARARGHLVRDDDQSLRGDIWGTLRQPGHRWDVRDGLLRRYGSTLQPVVTAKGAFSYDSSQTRCQPALTRGLALQVD
jgi:hypothetical protein